MPTFHSTPTTVHTILDQIRNTSTSESDKGTRFEELIRQYLLNDPVHRTQFSNVWRWKDFPGRGNRPDTGIDIVAERSDGTGLVAIQCKFYAPDATIQKSNIDSFLAASSRRNQFVSRIIVSTTWHWSENADYEIRNQHPPVQRIDLHDLENSAIDWSKYGINRPRVELKPKHTLKPHQKEALEKVREGFTTQDRGRLIMACGTGKTFTSLKIAEELAGKGGLVLFLVPSLSLLSQTLREWLTESAIPLHCYAVCSDTKIGKHEDSDPTTPDDIAIPPTTNGKELAKNLAAAKRSNKMTVVFSTYQSIDALHEAQKKGMPQFDLIICDEAHRTTGAILESKEETHFVQVHNADFLKAKKRLYMTATPRLYSTDTKRKAEENEIKVWSMDEEEIYGQEFYRLGFSKAVDNGLLSDYKVIVIAVNDKHISPAVQRLLQDKNGKLKLPDAPAIIGCWNGLARKFTATENAPRNKRPGFMNRAVAFTTSIKQSEYFRDKFTEVITTYLNEQPDDKHTLKCEVHHVDGKMNSLERTKELQWLKEPNIEKNHCRILSNARCLSEGVDVPALDAVMFISPRKSQVDIVQSVGRVMRKAEGKEYGYIILPITVSSDVKPEDALADNERYKVVWDVLQALRAHDDRFNITINQIETSKQPPDNIEFIGVGFDDNHEPGTEQSVVPGFAQQLLDFHDIQEYKNAFYAKVVQKCGDKRYLENWAKDVATIADHHANQIKELISPELFHLEDVSPEYRETFDRFWAGLKQDLNPEITENEVIDMLSQHLITKPVFDALFGGFSFTKENPVSQSLDAMIDKFEKWGFDSKTGRLREFYESVQQRVSGEKSAAGKQEIIRRLYDKRLFNN